MKIIRSLELRKKISDTLKKKGIKPLQRYDPTGKKHSPKRYAKFMATLRKKFPPATLNCLVCKIDFEVPKRQASWRKTCSRKCYHFYQGSKKGWIKPINQVIRASKQYVEWRTKVFERDDFTCQICFTKGDKIQADHIKKFADFPELRFELSNGRTLCIPCHRKTPNYGNRK